MPLLPAAFAGLGLPTEHSSRSGASGCPAEVGVLMPGDEVPVIDRIWNEEGSVRHLVSRLGDANRSVVRCSRDRVLRFCDGGQTPGTVCTRRA